MALALTLGRRGMGRCWPNPAVGCVLAREDLDGRVVGRGWTQIHGRPHAETEALTRAGDLSRGATAYVTLEPCVMCVGAILQARVTRLVFGCLDPKGGAVESLYHLCDDSRLNHRVTVTGGILQRECAEILKGFFSCLRQSGGLTTSPDVK